MNYFDLHCDTPFELYKRKTPLASGGTHITAEKLRCFEKYAQIMDIWSQNDLSGQECYDNFFRIYDNFMRELAENPQFCFCRGSDDMENARFFSELREGNSSATTFQGLTRFTTSACGFSRSYGRAIAESAVRITRKTGLRTSDEGSS